MISSLEVRAFLALADVRPLAFAINDLNLRSRRPCPFSTYEYIANFVAHDEFHPPGTDPGVLFLCAFDREALVGWVALRRVTEHLLGVPCNKIEFLLTRDNDRPHVVSAPGDEERVCAAFYEHLLKGPGGCTFLEFKQQDIASRLYPPPPTVSEQEFFVRLFDNEPNGTIPVRWKSLDEYYRSLPRKVRGNVGRQARLLFDAGKVDYVSSSDTGALPALLDIYCSLERRSWKHDVAGTLGRHPERSHWFRGLVAPGQPMTLGISLVALDGTPVGGIINGYFANGEYALQIAYDRDYHHLAPGSVTLLMSVYGAISRGASSYNLLSSFAYYKERWQAQMTRTHAVQVFRRGSLHHLHALAGEYRRRFSAPNAPPDVDHFNPTRRAAEAVKDVPGRGPTGADLLYRSASARLLHRLMESELPVQRLTDDQLRAAMPFDTRRRNVETRPAPLRGHREPAANRQTSNHAPDGAEPELGAAAQPAQPAGSEFGRSS